ncbi:biosynthetic-type acetolactate synthase large subunit [Paenibacillus xanthanilyticus]|uniref:Acetolactate synthase n=1 Tax=Paenibacillus xanthanilyticus TaxID=1783531 RepID=A0ABV8K3B8_9BACL
MHTLYTEFLAGDAAALERLKTPGPLSGSEILLRSLLLEGVECVFGYPGGAVLYIYDAMHGNDQFRHVLARHEQGAIHAADGYARASGRTGVCLATSGPGAANLVTGVATAYMDSVPLVVITGNVPTDQIGTDAFQEADIVGMTMPVTKHSFFVRHAADIAPTVRKAFHIASTGRKGPVLIDIPKDVSAQNAEFAYPGEIDLPGYRLPGEPDAASIEAIAAKLAEARRPVILAGGGIVHGEASERLAAFAAASGIPVVTTLMGLGALPASHPCWIGFPGMHGSVAANRALVETDCLLALGARFDDRVTMKLAGFAPDAAIIHVDIDAAEIGKILPAHLSVQADASAVLGMLLDRSARFEPSRCAPWLTKLRELNERQPLRYDDHDPARLKPQFVIELISRTEPERRIVTTDVGQHQMWAAQFCAYERPRSFLTSGGLGTMGFGLPSAIGAQIARPDALVVSVNGDGGIQMCAQELAVCSIHRLPIKIVVLNNRTLGMIRQWQEVIYEGRHSHIDLSGSPDFVKLAEAYGVKGLRASDKTEAARVWQEALAHDGPVLLDFWIDPEELVLPMIRVGGSLSDMITEVPGVLEPKGGIPQ